MTIQPSSPTDSQAGQATVLTRRDRIPEDLKELPQWVIWSFQNKNTSRLSKVPHSPSSGNKASVVDPSTWSTFDTACQVYADDPNRWAGIGFVFTDDDPFVGIDLDDCRSPHTCRLNEFAENVVARLDCYSEVSPSGTGVKCIARVSSYLSSRRSTQLNVEFYSGNRFFTITGDAITACRQIPDRTEAVDQLYHSWFKSPAPVLENHSLPLNWFEPTDEQVLAKARRANNGQKFDNLFRGDMSDYQDDHSAADLGLCRILAFWCGPNPEQIDRLFRKSFLYRAKWERPLKSTGSTYGQNVIQLAIASQAGNYYRWPSGDQWEALAVGSIAQSRDQQQRVLHVKVSSGAFNHAKAQAHLSGLAWPVYIEKLLISGVRFGDKS